MPQSLAPRRVAAIAVNLPYALALMLGVGLSGGCSDREVNAAGPKLTEPNGTRLVIEPERRSLLECSDSEWTTLVDKIFPSITPEKLGPSGCLHAMRLLGVDLCAAPRAANDDAAPPRLLDLFLHAERARAAFRVPLIFETRHGIRYRRANPVYPVAGKMRESHQGQVFASLAEMGVPLATPIRLKSATRSVEDVLVDAIAAFDFRGEIEWKCIAAMHYLVGRASWSNRYGEDFGYDDIADQLVDRDIRQASCGGTHLFHALNLLVRIDMVRPVLSADSRTRARSRLAAQTALAVAGQRPDGSWPHAWWEGGSREPSEEPGSVLVTGHLAESFLYLPGDLSVEDDVLRRAGLWLLGRLREATPAECKTQLCPLTHAACVVRQLR